MKKYTSNTRSITALPRNKRLRQAGVSATAVQSAAYESGDWLPRSVWDSVFTVADDGTLRVRTDLLVTGGVTMYADGTAEGGSGSGGVIVVDGLESTMTDAALSANMGRVLKDLIDSKSTVTSWAQLEGKPTTVAGFGITDAYTKAQTASLLAGYLTTEAAAATYVTLATEQTLTGAKTFSALATFAAGATVSADQTLTVGGVTLSRHSDGTLFVDGNIVVSGGVTIYGDGSASGGSGGVVIVDGLESEMTDAALSANMGRVLKDLIDSKSTVTTWEQLQNKPSWIGSSKPSYSYSELTGKPTTLSGFGITDAPTKTGAGASGTWAISIKGKAANAAQIVPEQYTGNLNSATSSYFGKLLYAGGSNAATNKPSGVDAYGMAVIRTADGYTGQLLMSANAATGLYWRTAANASLGAWNKVLDSANYNDYTPTKTGGGASGTWGISIKGNAATASKLTNLTSTDAASSSATWRRVWMSYNDNVNGRPAYSDSLAYQTSTNTLKAPNLSCTTSVSIGGIVLSVKGGNLYIDGNVVTSGGVTMYGDGSTSGGSGGGGNVTIVDGLTSSMTDAALSANMGRVLNESINAFRAEADGKYLTAHQTIYNLTFAAGAFSSKIFDPNGAAATVNIPQKLTHLTNNLFVNGTQTATTNAWTGTVDGLTAYYDGLTIDYRLPYAGTGTAATLNLNGLGAKTVYNGRKGSTTTHYVAGSIIRLTYYGGAFYADAYYDSNTTYSGFVCGYCSTAAAKAAKAASATSFALTSGVTVLIRFTAANTSKSALTLNVNSTGAKTVYINGAASSSSNYTLPAGTYPCHYDGTYWHVYTNGTYRFTSVTAGTFYGALSGNASTASKWQTARTLTLTGSVTGSASIDGSGNVSLATSTNHTHPYLPLAGGTMTGSIKSGYASGTWINGVTNSCLSGTYTTYGAIASLPVKSGRVSISTYPSNTDLLYFGYASAAQISAGTNAFNQQMTWDAVNNKLTAASLAASSTLTVGGIAITRSSAGVLKIDGNLIVTGGVTMYSDGTGGSGSGGAGSVTIVDGLTSTDASAALSANQGRILKGMIDGKSDSGHTHSWDVITGKPTTFAPASHTHPYLPLSGGTMTGVLSLLANQYTDGYNGALNCNNSDIYGLNSIYTADLSGTQAEGIHFYRTASTVDTFRIKNGVMYFAPNRALGGTATEYTVMHSGNYGSWAAAKSHTHSYLPLSGGTLTGNVYIAIDTDVSTDSTTGSLVIGNKSGENIGIDSNEIMARNGNHASDLYINNDGGNIHVGSGGITNNGTYVTVNDSNGNGYEIQGVNYSMSFQIGTGNVNRGIFGDTEQMWLLYFDSSNTILNKGNVGIGTTSPSYKLHVNGNGYYSGNLVVGSVLNNDDINSTDGAGLLSYHPKNWNGVSSDQWGAGAINSQGVIRSSNTDLIHYRDSYGNTTILDSYNYSRYALPLIGGTMTGVIHLSWDTNDNMNYTTTNPRIIFSENGIQKVGIVYTDFNSYRASKGLKIMDVDNNDTENVWLEVQGSLYIGKNIQAGGGITMYSDLRKKTAIENVELRLDEIADAPLFSHVYKDDDKRTLHVGSSAQYWEGLRPGWFTREDSDGYYMMEIQNCALAAAISLGREVRRYESSTDQQIRQLKRRVAELEDEIELIKKNNQQNNA